MKDTKNGGISSFVISILKQHDVPMFVPMFVCLEPISSRTVRPIWLNPFLLVSSWSGEGFRPIKIWIFEKKISRIFFAVNFENFFIMKIPL